LIRSLGYHLEALPDRDLEAEDDRGLHEVGLEAGRPPLLGRGLAEGREEPRGEVPARDGPRWPPRVGLDRALTAPCVGGEVVA